MKFSLLFLASFLIASVASSKVSCDMDPLPSKTPSVAYQTSRPFEVNMEILDTVPEASGLGTLSSDSSSSSMAETPFESPIAMPMETNTTTNETARAIMPEDTSMEASEDDYDIQPLIMGGNKVPTGSATFVAGLRHTADGESFCGGSLITSTVVLTAAHCTLSGVEYVSIGSRDRAGSDSAADIVQVTSVVSHPDYNAETQSSDMALLFLERPSTKYLPTALSSTPPSTGQTATVHGWGTTSVNGPVSKALQKVGVPVISHGVCKQMLGDIDKSMLCAGAQGGMDSCQGDSGGPLTIIKDGYYAQIGCVSWGVGCGEEGMPGIYADVRSLRSFIDEQTGYTAVWR